MKSIFFAVLFIAAVAFFLYNLGGAIFDPAPVTPPPTDPLVATCAYSYVGVLAVAVVVGGFLARLRMRDEARRTKMYNDLIQADNDLIDGRITQKQYDKVHDAFYAEFPNGDVSL